MEKIELKKIAAKKARCQRPSLRKLLSNYYLSICDMDFFLFFNIYWSSTIDDVLICTETIT